MLSTFSIRAKVTAIIALLLASMAGMGLLAILKMRAINNNTVEIATNWLPSIRELGELRTGVITYRNVLREHMLAESLEHKQAAEKTLESVVENNTKIRQRYETMITSPEERALYDEWVKNWNASKKGAAKAMELWRQEPGKVPHEAKVLNRDGTTKLSMAPDDTLKKDIDLTIRAQAAKTNQP